MEVATYERLFVVATRGPTNAGQTPTMTYCSNPVVLWDHKPFGPPIGRCTELRPVGRGYFVAHVQFNMDLARQYGVAPFATTDAGTLEAAVRRSDGELMYLSLVAVSDRDRGHAWVE